MASTAALFARHEKGLQAILGTELHVNEKVLLYAAAMICEAIRNEQEDVDLRVIEPNGGKRPA